MLRVDSLEVRYGRLVAVHGISLEVGDGECVGLIGPNGAGKTTTLSAIAGVLSPASGTIEIGGESVGGEPPEAIVRRGVSLVPEGRRIFTTLTVEENLRIGSSTRKDGEVDADIDRMMERFPVLRRYAATHAGKLSGGEQQQLAIARALMSRPRLLLLDEPSLGLAPLMVDLVFELVAQLREEGITMLLVEQNGRRTVDLADRTYVLAGGRIAMVATGVKDLEEVERAYFGGDAAVGTEA
ncbi:MAG: ABC transporter ATP-binding protein [Actinobacteria bacterium]|nr:ABC transporter ATP-binding protein [Actinomycetota bacterium]